MHEDRIDSMYVVTKEETELFKNFFSKFKVDREFKLLRIVDTLNLHLYEDNGEFNNENFTKIKMSVDDIFLLQSDWNEKILISHENISNDTIITHLRGDDTGLHVKHKFIRKGSKWYLASVIDYST